VPRPYQPPITRRAQAIESAPRRLATGASPPRVPRPALLIPLVLLLGVVAVAAAAEWRALQPASAPVAAGPTTSLAAATAQPTLRIAGTPATSAQSGATPQPGATAVGVAGAAAAKPAATAAPVAAAPTPGPTSAPAAPAVPTPDRPTNAANGPFKSYRVQQGDTVKVIAQNFGVPAQSIIQASGLPDADHLRVGQVLTIPDQAGYLYRVQPGETLDQIAARTGVPSEIIVSASKLPDAAVRAGDVILIPESALARGK
jgi:LysM repeat protein